MASSACISDGIFLPAPNNHYTILDKAPANLLKINESMKAEIVYVFKAKSKKKKRNQSPSQ